MSPTDKSYVWYKLTQVVVAKCFLMAKTNKFPDKYAAICILLVILLLRDATIAQEVNKSRDKSLQCIGDILFKVLKYTTSNEQGEFTLCSTSFLKSVEVYLSAVVMKQL